MPEWHKKRVAREERETEETDSETYGRCAVGELESIRSSENPVEPLMEGGNGGGGGGASIPGPGLQAHTHREAKAEMRDILQRWRPEERVRKSEGAVSCSV